MPAVMPAIMPAIMTSHSYEPSQKLARSPRPRWVLVMQAGFWRLLMRIGMLLHKTAPPRPPAPDFVRVIDASVSSKPGQISLHFYVPPAWHRTARSGDGHSYPLVVNFHGGGFTLGRATDDARWCSAVVARVGAVVVSVGYRLAPEHAFPTAVEDGADAVLHLARRAAEFGLDVQRIALTGFSSGANMCFTVPLRLQQELELEGATDGELRRASVVSSLRPPLQKALSQGRVVTASDTHIAVRAVVAWYPPVDYTRSRAERRATAHRLDQQLPQIFTDLFDESYLQPPTMDMAHPFLSPGAAPNHMLSGLPEELVILACEWDMLLDETERFVERLRNEVGKTVHFTVVEGVPHAFDKAPNPFKQPPQVAEVYAQACEQLARLLA
jgi:acetyl esterase/lipase